MHSSSVLIFVMCLFTIIVTNECNPMPRDRIYQYTGPHHGYNSHSYHDKYFEQSRNESKDSAEHSKEQLTATGKICHNCRFKEIGNGYKNINEVVIYSSKEEPTLKNH
ncbi:uncharacterized protein LOC123669936 [Melitaea cinxia]|uniref:uncharacterized protein LOC123669936 n=1 Tax=Melitaea cinxia TaxID=113334 RepID=UPI001E26FE08|nr:uncharacterized protein LOC123669936 [Melitaea cinxia]